MPNINVTRLPKSEVKLDFSVEYDEIGSYLLESAKEISQAKPITGFRPGHAGLEEVKRAYGEMAVLEHALERIIRAMYAKAIAQEGLEIVGSPAVQVDKVAPGQPLIFSIIAPIEPQVLDFPDLKTCQITKKTTDVTDVTVDTTIEEMRKMRRVETLVDRPATVDDLVVVDLEILRDGVVIEGGSGRGYRIFMNEPHYIPGFTKELEGVKADEERTFTLPFPEEHYQKHLAGKAADFRAKATGVFALELPEVNDVFAQGAGLKTLLELRQKLRENMLIEQQERADQAMEIELLEKLVDATKFSEVPDVLIQSEVRVMLEELQRGVEDQDMKWEDYLASTKKTSDQMRLELAPQAIRRVKTAILAKALAKKESISVSETELDQEIDQILDRLRADDAETRARVASPEYRHYVGLQMRNRKTLAWLKEQCVK